jgi:Na+-transporting NADH:ubiquinone oxidoreductase subunit A
MGKNITLRRGYDIRLKGTAEKVLHEIAPPGVIALRPGDFPDVTPRLALEPGQEVLAGQTLFLDKNRPELRFASPVSGEVADVVRGEKRRILEVRVLVDAGGVRYHAFAPADPQALSREAVVERLLESGCWPYVRQRPYSTIAHPADRPKGVFVSCFDSAPLAPDLDYITGLEPENFETGLQALRVLAEGRLHLGQRDGGRVWPTPEGVQLHRFRGPHPAGNVGVQIHHLDPIRKGELVWYVHPQDVVVIGRLFREGRYRADRVVALTGSCVATPRYYRVMTGQRVGDVLAGQLTSDHCRIIQGNVLTGQPSAADEFLSFCTNHLTVIPEGDRPEFLGWLLPGLQKLSLSRTYFSWLFPKRTYDLDTNTHGEERAFVMTGQYDRVLPMNILPVYLLKAILAKDIERMEQLGIYEVAEEDLALCEFVCTSKIKVQRIVAEGLELMKQEA